MRHLLVLLALVSACTPAYLREDRWESDGYTLTFRDVAAADTTTFEYQLQTDVPPERLWNVVTDIKAFYDVSSNLTVLEGPTLLDAETIRTVIAVKPYWFAWSVTTVMMGRVLPQRLGWENECVNHVLKDCYMVFSIVPLDQGRRSMIKASGYMKRPWFVSHGHMVDVIGGNLRAMGPGIRLLASRAKYDVPNAFFPWAELAALHDAGPAAALETRRRRLALAHLAVFPEAVTNEAVGAVTTDYLATRLTGSGAFDVVTPSDMDVMARYLGENWALICKDDDACGAKLARMADSRYLLSGELRMDAEAYHVSLVMLDEQKGAAVWRMQRTLPPDLRSVKQAIDVATVELSRTALP